MLTTKRCGRPCLRTSVTDTPLRRIQAASVGLRSKRSSDSNSVKLSTIQLLGCFQHVLATLTCQRERADCATPGNNSSDVAHTISCVGNCVSSEGLSVSVRCVASQKCQSAEMCSIWTACTKCL